MRLSLIVKVCLAAIIATHDRDVALVAIAITISVVWSSRNRPK